MGARGKHQLLRRGETAPEFRLQVLGGDAVALAEVLAEGPVVLAFFKTSCPVCQLTLPFLDRIWNGRNPQAPRIFGISQDDSADTRAFNKRFHVTFPVLLDPPRERYPVSNAYGISSVPTLYVIEQDGTVGQVIEGFVKREMASLGTRAGVNLFSDREYVPEWQAG